jgi:hypothetical protein
MRLKRHRILIGIGCILLSVGIGYGLALGSGGRPALATVAVRRHEVANDLLIITVTATNIGSTVLVSFGDPLGSIVRFQTPSGWTNVSPRNSISSSIILRPGRSQAYQIAVPSLPAVRFQVGCYFQRAGVRSSVAGRLIESEWWNRFAPILDFALRFVPDGTGEQVEFWSQEMELAQRD